MGDAKVVPVHPDCPDRSHDPYRVVGKPCPICQTAAMGARSVTCDWESLAKEMGKLQAEKELLRGYVVCLKAENTALRKTVDNQAYIICNGGAHATTTKLRAELAQRDQEAQNLISEVQRLQEELRKCHHGTSAAATATKS